ncbi:MAG TPA: UDP-N-acetylmuramoyl-L-alanyl-D-glutamate--2,6-diaminopimelate ligase [Beijerinckiaceae bacterium]|jgi:UDP-N-acetylmuramoyl-L-alanyl-D-glutamate--2,6-diaminopimelate ligase|nr:UDP-N-acetylmuramoyl-L-alanyl-D-glutamate--2,6-diaminopimelate ligase [Microvirga sp.]HZB38067.1 UDP-N-acetylmuramoyl-L-alanyl-D-glutamate--2,6-diaminopimelate ligase [Beijerinckiaceae bacterium]
MSVPRPATLGDLFPEAQGTGHAQRSVAGLTADSRKVKPGYVFVAVPGTKLDGMAFMPQALAAGAMALVGEAERPPTLNAAVAYVRVNEVRRALARAAARFHPRQPGTIVAVTGTSGKSSVADFVRQIFAALGHRSASLGTLGVVTSEGPSYGSLTTPDPVTLHETLDRLVGEGVTHLAMEASSHGLDQRRLDGVRLTAGAFTNLGRDHLDYHPTFEDYLAAKLRLFEALLAPGQSAVVNADGAYAESVIDVARRQRLNVQTTGRAGETIKLVNSRSGDFGQDLELRAPSGVHRQLEQAYSVRLPLIGAFQAENALVAAGLAVSAGGDPPAVMAALGKLRGAPGRLEKVGEVNGAVALVDYAHKPDALEHVLDTLRPFAKGRLVCVFGCGGDRDRGKRPIMGRIAVEKADVAIVTDDNPRTEVPASIRAEILAGAKGAREIGDRSEAIHTAVRELRPGDVLVVAGKGHETGQIVGDRTLPFSDHDVLRAAIAEVKG